MDKKFDFVILGSSPLMLIEALYYSKQGKSVAIIESKNEIGGSWHCFGREGISDSIEVGCHIWQKDVEVMEFLKDAFEMRVVSRDPQPKTIIMGKRFPYYFISISYMLNRFKKKSRFSLSAMKLYKSLLSDFFREMFSRTKYCYPIGGSKELIDCLLDRVNASTISLMPNTTLKKINLSSMTLECNGNMTLSFGNLVATNKMELADITLSNGEKYKAVTRLSAVFNFYFLIEMDEASNLTYIETYQDKVIQRVADMTFDDDKLLGKNRRLICCDIHEKAAKEYSVDELEEILIKKMLKWKVINKKARIINAFFKKYPFNAQSNEVNVEYNEKMNPEIIFLKSNNLIPSFSDNLDRWKSEFS